MKSQRALHAVILQQRLAASYFLQNFRGKVLAVQQQTELRLVERGIIEQRQEHVRRMMMQQRSELFAGRCASALAIGFVSRHRLPSRPKPRPPREKSAICRFAPWALRASTRHRFARRKSASGRCCLRSWPAKTPSRGDASGQRHRQPEKTLPARREPKLDRKSVV